MFKIFKKKVELEGLEKAKELGLITELEFLKLKSDRADEDLKNYSSTKKTKNKK